jgi:hypothetical protein
MRSNSQTRRATYARLNERVKATGLAPGITQKMDQAPVCR